MAGNAAHRDGVSRQNDRVILGLCAAAVVLSAALEVRAPDTVCLGGFPRLLLPPTCLLRRLTGHPCPGCGLTRSFVSTAHGNLAAAFGYHPLGPIFFLLAAAQLPYRLWLLRSGPRRASRRNASWLIWLCTIALALAWGYGLARAALGG